MTKIITPDNFDENADSVFETYEGKGFWQEPFANFDYTNEDDDGNELGYTKSAYQVAKEALCFQAGERRVIIANTAEQLAELLKKEIEMN